MSLRLTLSLFVGRCIVSSTHFWPFHPLSRSNGSTYNLEPVRSRVGTTYRIVIHTPTNAIQCPTRAYTSTYIGQTPTHTEDHHQPTRNETRTVLVTTTTPPRAREAPASPPARKSVVASDNGYYVNLQAVDTKVLSCIHPHISPRSTHFRPCFSASGRVASSASPAPSCPPRCPRPPLISPSMDLVSTPETGPRPAPREKMPAFDRTPRIHLRPVAWRPGETRRKREVGRPMKTGEKRRSGGVSGVRPGLTYRLEARTSRNVFSLCRLQPKSVGHVLARPGFSLVAGKKIEGVEYGRARERANKPVT